MLATPVGENRLAMSYEDSHLNSRATSLPLLRHSPSRCRQSYTTFVDRNLYFDTSVPSGISFSTSPRRRRSRALSNIKPHLLYPRLFSRRLSLAFRASSTSSQRQRRSSLCRRSTIHSTMVRTRGFTLQRRLLTALTWATHNLMNLGAPGLPPKRLEVTGAPWRPASHSVFTHGMKCNQLGHADDAQALPSSYVRSISLHMRNVFSAFKHEPHRASDSHDDISAINTLRVVFSDYLSGFLALSNLRQSQKNLRVESQKFPGLPK